jgi:NADPH2:quinone reductase
MKAWLLPEPAAGIDALRIDQDVPTPALGHDEILLRLEYAALNPADRYLAQGEYPARPACPHILGRDGLGTIAAVADDVDQSRHKIGDRRLILRSEVGVNRPGTFAQFVAVPAESAAAVPQTWTVEQSAGAALVYLTAYQALTTWGDLAPGIVLITGASGGVGVASIHLAKAMLHQVVALSRDPGKREKLLQQGADFAIDPQEPDWPRKLVKQTLQGQRVNLAIDNIGGPLFNQVIDTLADRAKVSCVGRLAGPVPEFNTATLFFRRIKIGGVAVGAYTAAESRQAWAQILQFLAENGARPIVDSVWPFEQLKEAFARLAQGPMGKVLLKID